MLRQCWFGRALEHSRHDTICHVDLSITLNLVTCHFETLKTQTNIQIYLSVCDTPSSKDDITFCSFRWVSNRDPPRAFVRGSAFFFNRRSIDYLDVLPLYGFLHEIVANTDMLDIPQSLHFLCPLDCTDIVL